MNLSQSCRWRGRSPRRRGRHGGGFPVASPGDSRRGGHRAADRRPVICALAPRQRPGYRRRPSKRSLPRRRRVHVFLAPAHPREFKLKVTRRRWCGCPPAHRVRRERCEDVEFSARTRPARARLPRRGGERPSTPARPPSTFPTRWGTGPVALRRHIENAARPVRGIERCASAWHCHDDLGMRCEQPGALQAGARQVSAPSTASGSRGNCSLEEVVMALRTPRLLRLRTGIAPAALLGQPGGASDRLPRARTNKAWPQNASRHESGIHQTDDQPRADVRGDAPEDGAQEHNLCPGPAQRRMRTAGSAIWAISSSPSDRPGVRGAEEAGRQEEGIYDGDLDALLVGLFQNGTARRWQLASLNAVSGTGSPPTAAVSLRARDGRKLDEGGHRRRARRRGVQVHRAITGVKAHLRDFYVASVTAAGPQGEVVVASSTRVAPPRPRPEHRHRAGHAEGRTGGGEPDRRRPPPAQRAPSRDGLWRSLNTTLFEKIWDAHLWRPRPGKRRRCCTSICTWCTSHLAANLRGAARAWAARAPAGPHGRHHGSSTPTTPRRPGTRLLVEGPRVRRPARALRRTAPGSASSCTRSLQRSSRESSSESAPRWGSRCPGHRGLRRQPHQHHGAFGAFASASQPAGGAVLATQCLLAARRIRACKSASGPITGPGVGQVPDPGVIARSGSGRDGK